MKTDLFTSSTYTADKELFNKLGLKQFQGVESHTKPLHLGKVKRGEAWTKIWVSCLPAQFYNFEIYSPEAHKVYKCSTGSGTLSCYWPTVEKLMDDMFVINDIIKLKS